MASQLKNRIQIFEWGKLVEDQSYDGVIFEKRHLEALGRYEVSQSNFQYFRTYYNQVRFNQYVGVIKVGGLTIEVLPKTDKHNLDKAEWQNVLLEMLLITLQVEAKTTTDANIRLQRHSVLEAYLQLFLDETSRLIHRGLVKKYRTIRGNQYALKGKLLVQKHITHNSIHAERFYVKDQVYDRDNVFNYLLQETLKYISNSGMTGLNQDAKSLLLHFPDCTPFQISEKLFSRLPFDRKTEDYRRAIELARIILLNYHPDLKGGKNDILAIMFDMNHLWESFIHWSLLKGARTYENLKIRSQNSKNFWKPEKGRSLSIRPDIVIDKGGNSLVIDTKWKYESRASVEDVRQLFTYGQYFQSSENFLLYPAKLENDPVSLTKGSYYDRTQNDLPSNESCGLMFADLIKGTSLNKEIGVEILDHLLNEKSEELRKPYTFITFCCPVIASIILV